MIIGVGSSLAGEYNADYNTPGSESKAASDLTEERFGGYSGQEIYVVWKDEAGAKSPARPGARRRLLRRGRAGRPHRRAHPDPGLGGRQDRRDHAPADRPRLGGREGGRREADRRRRGATAATGSRSSSAAIRSTPRRRQASPEGIGFLGAAIVLLIAFGSVVAAGLPLVIALVGLGITSGGLIVLLANVVDVPDWTTAVSGLIGIGVGIDYSLLVLTRFRSAMNDGKDRHDAVVEAVTTAGRSVIIAGAHRGDRRPRPLPDRPALHVRRRHLGLARRAGRDARRGHPAAGAALVPRPEGRPPADPVPRPDAQGGGQRRVARRALEPRRPAAALDRPRSPPPRCCSRWPRPRSACASASPTPATTRRTR